MMGEQGVYIFDNETDFLRVIEQINQYYKDKPNIIYLYKKLESYEELNKEIDFINKCSIDGFSGFISSNKIKLTITDWFNCKYCITYLFNGSGRNQDSIYSKLNKYLKKKENIYI